MKSIEQAAAYSPSRVVSKLIISWVYGSVSVGIQEPSKRITALVHQKQHR